eukprot:292261-Rhodomonas_salina.1
MHAIEAHRSVPLALDLGASLGGSGLWFRVPSGDWYASDKGPATRGRAACCVRGSVELECMGWLASDGRDQCRGVCACSLRGLATLYDAL